MPRKDRARTASATLTPPSSAGAIRSAPFIWHSYDLRPELPQDWQEEILAVAMREARARRLVPTSSTSREASAAGEIPVLTVGGDTVAEQLPWLRQLYLTRFRDLAQALTTELVSPASRVRYGINLNVQRGNSMSYECHVDSNPIEGLLYITDHPPGTGGELLVANDGDVSDRAGVERNATRIHPVAGHLVFFDAREHSHYVAPMRDPHGVRVVAAMNFYTPSCPESSRPPDLDEHLFGKTNDH